MIGKINEKNFIQHEFIGLKTTIIASPCKSLENISGKIIEETMNTFKVECLTKDKKKILTIPKHKTIFRFIIPVERNNNLNSPIILEVDGSILTKRPEDRIKKLAKLANKMKLKSQKLKDFNHDS